MKLTLSKRPAACFTPGNADVFTAKPYHCLALSLARLGDGVGAERAFQEGLGQPGGLEELRLAYARFLVDQDRPVDALNRLHELVTENPRQHRGLGHWRANRFESARVSGGRPRLDREARRNLPEESARPPRTARRYC